jgi:hypothetical protein
MFKLASKRILKLASLIAAWTAPIEANAAWITLKCQFTNAAQISQIEDNDLKLSNIKLPDDFFKPFSMKTNRNQLIDITIERWTFSNALGGKQECYSDPVTISCIKNSGDSIFLDKKSLLGTANIMSGAGYGEPVTISYFRCQPENP